jgi:Alginate export
VARIGVALGFVAGTWTLGASAQIAAPAPETISIGEWELAPVVEARVRAEYRRDLDDQDRGFLVERARLGVDVQRTSVRGRVVLQDARVWNVAAGTDRAWGEARLALTGAYEAWAEAHTASPRPTFVRVGRQPVTWGEGRLLGTADWSPTGRSLDAVRGQLAVQDGAFELLAASLSETATGGLTAYGELLGARAQWAWHPLLAIEGYVLARLAQVDPLPFLDISVRGQTYAGALRLHGDAYATTWGVEGAYEIGRAENLGEDRAAWAVAGHVAHRFERMLLLPSIRLAVAHASGDSGGSRYRAFDPLLPDVHVWHGAMDLFAWSNEQELSARIGVAPWIDAIVFVEYRYARLAEATGTWRAATLAPVGSMPKNAHADLGHEIDASLTWSPWVPVELTAGYSVLFLGEGARTILGGGPAQSQFGYAQAGLRLP